MAAALPAGLLAGCAGGSPSGTGAFVQAAVAKKIPVDDAAMTQAEQGSESFALTLLCELGASNRAWSIHRGRSRTCSA
jgi:hypothetical protein